jgi:nucleotide-binding universal stress UspA family protein
MKSILIPTDFSMHSEYALEHVIGLMHDAKTACRLILVNTYMSPRVEREMIITMNDQLKRISRQGLEEQKAAALKIITQPSITVESTSQMGSLNHVILQLVQTENIDLVAMGKDGGKHVDSIATILKIQNCPLLITYLKQ